MITIHHLTALRIMAIAGLWTVGSLLIGLGVSFVNEKVPDGEVSQSGGAMLLCMWAGICAVFAGIILL